MVHALNTRNLFSYYLFHPNSSTLKEKDRKVALVATIAFGILTFGLTHLVCRLFFYRKPSKSLPAESKINQQLPLKVVSDSGKNVQQAKDKAISSKPKQPNQYLFDFYKGTGKDIEGRTLEEMIKFSDRQKEDCHSFIQWLFPLNEASNFNSTAPVLTKNLTLALKSDPIICSNVKRSFQSMMQFYGLQYDENTKQVVKAPNYNKRIQEWCTQGNHNFQRITRILKSLRIFGLETEANAFFQRLQLIHIERPSACHGSFGYWQGAMIPKQN